MNLLLRQLGTGRGISARQAGEILPKAVAGDESMKIFRWAEVVGVVVPSTHIRSWSRHTLALAKRLQQSVFVKVEEHIMVVVELLPQQTGEELYLVVGKDRQRRLHGHRDRVGHRGRMKSAAHHGGTRNSSELEELTSGCVH